MTNLFVDGFSEADGIYQFILWQLSPEIVEQTAYYIDMIILEMRKRMFIDETWNLETHLGNSEKVKALLDLLGNQGEKGFIKLLNILDDMNFSQLAKDLRKKQKEYCGPQDPSKLQKLSKYLIEYQLLYNTILLFCTKNNL